MEGIFGNFVYMYLLMPLIALVLAGAMFFVAKKNELLGNKKVIFYFLITVVILVLPALLGFIDYWFMPYAYIGLMVLYLFLGYYNLKILAKIIDGLNEKPYYVEFLIVFTLTFVGVALFSLVFNLCNELQYGLWAATCMLTFILPTLFLKTFNTFMDIPLEVYLIWSYKGEQRKMTDEDFDRNKMIIAELEIFKHVEDKKPLNIKAHSSEVTPFGAWFKTFISDYNKKYPEAPIFYEDDKDSYGWIFYVTTSILGRKRYIDPNLTFAQNKLKEKNIIIAKRVQYETNLPLDEKAVSKNNISEDLG